MEPGDLTIRVLQEIRDGVGKTNTRLESLEKTFETRLDSMEKTFEARFEAMDRRFEVIETTLRDLAQQMVMLARGVKSALEVRERVEQRLEDHEKRLAELEKRSPH